MDEKEPQGLDEYECPVCTLLMVEPCTLACAHSLCIQCALQIQQFTDSTKCPLCRKPFQPDISINQELQSQLKMKAPSQYEERKIQLEEQKLLEEKKEKIELVIGNKHRSLSKEEAVMGNDHEWTMYVKSKGGAYDLNKIVKRVVYKLHPTFHPDTYYRNEEPYELSMMGWGTFKVKITLEFKSKLELPPLELDHNLSFHGQGVSRNWTFKADLSKL